jgi:hypothetical protein
MKPPLLVCSTGEIQLYDSIEALLADNDEASVKFCELYDSAGRILRMDVYEESQGWLKPKKVETSLVVESTDPIHRIELRLLLIEFLIQYPEYGWVNERVFELSVEKLIGEIVKKNRIKTIHDVE